SRTTVGLPPIRLTLLQRRHHQRASYYGQGHPLIHQIQTHMRSHSQYHIISPCHTKSQSMQLAGKLEDIMSSTMLHGPVEGEGKAHGDASTDNLMENVETDSVASMGSNDSNSPDAQANAVFVSKQGQAKITEEQQEAAGNACCSADYHDLSTIEFGIRIADFMPLAFKTVPVAGLAEKELELLHGLRQLPHVIQLQDSFVNDNGDTVLVLPMLKPFDVHAVNKNLCSVRKTMRQVLTGLAAVHAKDIVHLDINPSNLMVTHAKRDVVVIDFGLSMTIDRSASEKSIPVCGTTGYIAPEILHPSAYEEYDPMAADLYSLGIVLGEMLEEYIPDCDLHYFGSKYLGLENTNQTVAALKEFISQGAMYPKVLVQAADLLQNMLQENPKDRRSAQELLDSHPFLAVGPPSSGAILTSTKTKVASATLAGAAGGNLELCEWTCRLQEIKYQRYLYQEQTGCEVYRYR
ncbi:Calcium-dependent protein kinase 4, partial [Linnemannia schmuckeri]